MKLIKGKIFIISMLALVSLLDESQAFDIRECLNRCSGKVCKNSRKNLDNCLQACKPDARVPVNKQGPYLEKARECFQAAQSVGITTTVDVSWVPNAIPLPPPPPPVPTGPVCSLANLQNLKKVEGITYSVNFLKNKPRVFYPESPDSTNPKASLIGKEVTPQDLNVKLKIGNKEKKLRNIYYFIDTPPTVNRIPSLLSYQLKEGDKMTGYFDTQDRVTFHLKCIENIRNLQALEVCKPMNDIAEKAVENGQSVFNLEPNWYALEGQLEYVNNEWVFIYKTDENQDTIDALRKLVKDQNANIGEKIKGTEFSVLTHDALTNIIINQVVLPNENNPTNESINKVIALINTNPWLTDRGNFKGIPSDTGGSLQTLKIECIYR